MGKNVIMWVVGYIGWGSLEDGLFLVIGGSAEGAVQTFLEAVENGEVNGVYDLTGEDILVYQLKDYATFTTAANYTRRRR